MSCFEDAAEFIELAKNATDEAVLASAFSVRIKALGFEKFACVTMMDAENMPEHFVWVMDYPEGFQDHYVRQRYSHCDPTFHKALTTTVPFKWTEAAAPGDLSSKQKQLFGDAADFGIKYGYTVPIHSRLTRSATVNVVGSRDDIAPEAYNAVHLMSVYLHDAAHRLLNRPGPNKKVRLTDREQECMRWVALGKSDWEIGEILGISKNTAHYHVENAKNKLDCATRVQAVTEALLTNEISI